MSNENNFEEQLKRLQNIADSLEKDELGIEDTLKLFQEGMELGRECKKALSDIELKVNKIIKIDENDQIVSEPFDGDI